MTGWALALVEYIARVTGSIGNGGRLQVTEEMVQPFPRELCIGVTDLDELDRKSLVGFRLDCTSPGAREITKAMKAILWLSGGGYVTGYPLVDPPIFSLARTLPLGEYTIFAPSVRRALSLDRAFPVPLLDALAGYAHLREIGYEAKDIVVMGNSAGSGLSWSLMAYLAILKEGRRGDLGVPGEIIMISVSTCSGGIQGEKLMSSLGCLSLLCRLANTQISSMNRNCLMLLDVILLHSR